MVGIKKSRNNLNDVTADSITVKAGGAATQTVMVGGVLAVNTTQYSSPADTVENDAAVIPMEADVLSSNGKIVRTRVIGTKANNGNSVVARLYLGSTEVAVFTFASDPVANGSWFIETDIIRDGVGSQKVISRGQFGRGDSTNLDNMCLYKTSAEDETSALNLTVTLQNAIANAGDVVYEAATVELLN